MNRRKRILFIIIVALVATFAGSFMLPLAYSPWKRPLTRLFILVMVSRANQMRTEFLCKTDFEALLAACRELSRRAAKGDLKPGMYSIRSEPRDPQVLNFPQTILDIAPSGVYIDENDSGRVMLEMFGGLYHFGVLAYTEDFKRPSGYKYGDKELVPGLWYYDDNYKRNPNYKERIDALLQKKVY